MNWQTAMMAWHRDDGPCLQEYMHTSQVTFLTGNKKWCRSYVILWVNNCSPREESFYCRGTSRNVKQQRLSQARQEATQVREEYDAGVRASPYAGVLPTRHPPAPAAVHPTYSPGSDGIPHRVLPPPTCYLKGATATPRHSFHRSHPLHSSPSNPSLVNSDLGNPMCCPSYFRV